MDKIKQGSLFIISAPSGAGKSTLCSMLLNKYPSLNFSVSYTTRQHRETEKNGIDYFFVSKEQFIKMIDEDEFIEWAEVHGNYYGTSKKVINDLISSGKDVILDIDPQGAMQIKNKIKNGIFIFITTPSFSVLRERLIKRGTDKKDDIEKRLENAKKEITYYCNYDYLIVNDDSSKAFSDIESIYKAEKLKTIYIKDIYDIMENN